MKKMRVLVLLAICAVCGIASAEMMPTETYQRWDFNTGDNPAMAEICNNYYAPNGVWAIIGSGVGSPAPIWSNGVWSGSSITFAATIPNTSNTAPDTYKDIVIKIGYKGNLSLAEVVVGENVSTGTREISTYGSNGEWTMVTDTYRIRPNPTSENIFYGLGVNMLIVQGQQLDFVDISTVCVPEPMTMCLLGLGGLVISRRKR